MATVKKTAAKKTAPRARSALAKKGELIRRQIHGDAHVERRYAEADEFLRMFEDVTDEFCWGIIWSRPGIDRKTRAALSLGMTAAQCQAGAVKLHTKTCLRQGWTPKQVGEILLHAYCYAGVYASLSSFAAAREAIEEYKAEQRAAKRRR